MSSQPPTPEITLYFLGASRAIRIAWLLEELSLPYELVDAPRASNGLASEEFKAKIPTKMGKSPARSDGKGDDKVVVQESSAIAEYVSLSPSVVSCISSRVLGPSRSKDGGNEH
jgi:hypothetical protein